MKPEKIITTSLCAIAGGIIANNLTKQRENKPLNTLIGAGLVGIAGIIIYNYFQNNKADRINYILKFKSNRVYDGITKEYRLDKRIYEHQRDGKIFDEIIFDNPKPLKLAISIEKKRIKRFRPKYNSQHIS
ncbi:MAG: hypothetical protein QM539_07930 [Alphaproteobacteria bacterium]|nr:hypothetical protein [Alphaproteobacteria bacterium]